MPRFQRGCAPASSRGGHIEAIGLRASADLHGQIYGLHRGRPTEPRCSVPSERCYLIDIVGEKQYV